MPADYRLDRIDRRILKILQAEGRITNQALSERAALSPSACLARVRHLEEVGVIQGYHARLDPYKVDVGLVLLVEITLEGHKDEERARFETAIEAMPEVVEASHVSGDIDYLLKVTVADMHEWARLREMFVSDLGVARVTTHVLISKPKIFMGYPIKDV